MSVSNSCCDFDPDDYVSYDYKQITREEVKEILSDAPIGTFLMRDSIRDFDQKVLCVKEGPDIINSYKLIERVNSSGEKTCSILGKQDLSFSSFAKILEFYSAHYLNQSPLIKPAFFEKKVIALHDFQESGDDPANDLHFLKDEILTVVDFTIYDKWWKAKNSKNKIGLIPCDFVKRLKLNDPILKQSTETTSNNPVSSTIEATTSNEIDLKPTTDSKQEQSYENENPYGDGLDVECPFKAKVIRGYTPSPYETSHIPLRMGQEVNVLEMRAAGMWYGEVNNRKGLFPFIYVEVIKE